MTIVITPSTQPTMKIADAEQDFTDSPIASRK
jgi:hypothetical protein